MIQSAHDIAFTLIPNHDATICAPKQDDLTLIRKQGSKFVAHILDDLFVLDRVHLLDLALAFVLFDTN
jgi:hypothetical protein